MLLIETIVLLFGGMRQCILDTRNIGSIRYCRGGRTGAQRICLSHCERLVENDTHCTQLARERLALTMVCVALRATCVENSPTPLGGAGVLSSLLGGEKGALPHGKGPWRRATCGWLDIGQVKQPRVSSPAFQAWTNILDFLKFRHLFFGIYIFVIGILFCDPQM